MTDNTGISFRSTDDGPFIGFDFDKVRVDGDFREEVLDLVQRLDSYTEVSSSGKRLHVIAEGDRLDDRKNEEHLRLWRTRSLRHRPILRPHRRRIRRLHIGREQAYSRPRGTPREVAMKGGSLHRRQIWPSSHNFTTGARATSSWWTTAFEPLDGCVQSGTRYTLLTEPRMGR
uniref:Phage-related protein n=1 Tax=uncultured haloarchaeon TaxID=160804 RepID=A5YS62_9EURY|nr:phage-related protein [uncultured haloarchaeon]